MIRYKFSSMSTWQPLADKLLAGGSIDREEGLSVLEAPDALVPEILADAYRVRARFHGNTVKVHILANAKSGDCPEDCSFCAQSHAAEGAIDRYPLLAADDLVAQARAAHARGAWKFCIVTATRGPSERDLDTVCEAVRAIKREIPIRICTSLGILTAEKARRLAEAGVDRFNHNLETSERFFPEICSTHGYADRVETLKLARAAGMELCSGGIVGMGESREDLVDLALAVREAGTDSIPVNFLDPRPGTALAARARPTPLECLKVLCLFRFANPSRDIRAAGGREKALRALQPLALYPANSIFTEGYLTTGGNVSERDLEMIRDMGMTPLVDARAPEEVTA